VEVDKGRRVSAKKTAPGTDHAQVCRACNP